MMASAPGSRPKALRRSAPSESMCAIAMVGKFPVGRRSAWTLDDSAPRPVLRTRDVLLGCVQGGAALYCLRENATTPRYLARIALTDGRAESLFVPNPEFAHIRLGSVERLRWRNE